MPWHCRCRYPGSLGGDCDGSCQSPPPPEIWKDCEACAGQGYISETIHVYEAGCGFSHPDVSEAPCKACLGDGGFICEAGGAPVGASSNFTVVSLP